VYGYGRSPVQGTGVEEGEPEPGCDFPGHRRFSAPRRAVDGYDGMLHRNVSMSEKNPG